jgi:predicted ATPase/DNA-binding SARP family transcriptional activator
MSSHLALHLLGPPRLELDHAPIPVDRRKALALLAYLAVNREHYEREYLSALLWPDYEQEKAFANLRHILWETQQAIGDGWFFADRETIGLSKDVDIWLDVTHFESLITKSQVQNDISLRISLLTDSVKLYRNHFLTGFSLKDAPHFNEWAFAKSEDLRRQFANTLTMLSNDHCSLDQAETAIPYAQRLITLDPLNETSHRQLMQVYIQAGQHTAALKQYQTCEKLLRKELGVDPQPETRALYKQIRKGEFKTIQPVKQKELGAPGHNLPFQISKFIGREKELDEIADLIADHRLVTLIGTGGIGKTRLSLKVGEQLIKDYANGIWLVELASLSDPALVPQTVATLFNLVEGSEEPLIEKLIRVLRPKTMLLILDNCEHLLDACAQLAHALLRSCPSLKILTTSREPLGITGEALYHVPPLGLPDLQQALEKLLEYESIQLFEERARLGQEHFSLTMENASSVTQICHRLDGIPLAIELAAARVSMFSTEQIEARLNESFILLTDGSRTALPRQQTLRASIDWSWNLLSKPEQILLRRLSVFAGGWTLDAAESVCAGNGIEPQQMLDMMTQLTAKSLVVVNQESGHEKRYYLLETIRQYASDRLLEIGGEKCIRHNHLDYFLKLAGQAETELIGPRQMVWMEQLEDELDNIRAALEWSLNSEETRAEVGLQMAGSLWWFWYSRGHAEEGGDWLERALAFSVNQTPDLVTRAKALSKLGHLKINLARIQEGVALSQTLGAEGKVSLAFGLWVMGAWSYFYADFAQSKSFEEESLRLFREIGYRWGICESLTWLGAALTRLGNQQQATPLFEESLALARRAQDSNEIAWALWNLGTGAMARGDYQQSTMFLEESLALYKEINGYEGVTWLLGALGDLCLIQGDHEQTASYYEVALELQRERGHQRGIAEYLEKIGNAAAVRKESKEAARLLGAAEALRKSSGAVHYPYQLLEYEQFLEVLRPQLDQAALATLCAEGHAMATDQAIEYALHEMQIWLDERKQ